MKKIITKITGFLAAVFAGAAVMAPMAADTFAAPTGWVYNSAQKAYNYYGSNGKKYTGWHYMTKKEGEKKEHWNYFGSDGRLYTGWQWMDAGEGEKTPHWSYFGANGWLRTGWIQLGKGTAEPDGNTAKHWSYFGANGWLRTNWVQLGKGTSEPDGNSAKHWSYFGTNGWLREGMQDMGKGTNNPDGNAAKHKSYFGNNGWLVTDKTFTYSGKNYKADGRGWLSEVNNAAGKNTSKPAEEAKYTVTFADGNGKVLSTQTVAKGRAAAYPANPVKDGYKFIGWDKSFYNVTSNITVNAKWEKIPSLDEIRKGILDAVNKERKAVGAKALKLNPYMNETAQEKAEDMSKLGKLDHYSKNLGYFYNQFSAHGIRTIDSGENIALTYRYYTDEAMRSWMTSTDGHRETILNSAYTDLGVGYKDGYWVQQFAVNPEKTDPVQQEEPVYIECPHCHESANEKYIPHTWKRKSDGYDIGNLRSCSNCERHFYICPECGKEALSITGKDAKSGVNTYSCSRCGYIPVSTYIEKCNYCGKGIHEHSINDEFIIHYQYSSKEKDFQEISVGIRYCPESKRYIYVSESYNNMYKKFYDEMKKYYKKDSEILKNITWQRVVRNGKSATRQDVSAPRVRSLKELIDVTRLK